MEPKHAAGEDGDIRQRDLAILKEPARQSPVVIALTTLGTIRGIGVINFIVAVGLLVSRTLPLWVLALVPLAGLVILASGFATWWRFTFRANNDELVVTQGVISRNTLTIPWAKVQSVSIEEGLLQRLFGLVSASVDTAGGLDVEFAIHGIKRSQADALRRLASHGSPDPKSPIELQTRPVGDTPLAVRSPTQLVFLGMLGNPLGGLAVLGAALVFIEDILGLFGLSLPRFDGATVRLSSGLLLKALAVSILVFVLSWLGFGLRTLVVDWGLRLTKNEDAIELRAGLLKRRSQSSHVNKVQSVGVNRGPLLRRIGFSQVSLHTIGSGDFVMPGLTDQELTAVRQLVALPFPARPDRKISHHFVGHRVRLATFVGLLGAIPTAVLDRRFAPAWLLLPLLVAGASQLSYARHRWSISEGVLAKRSGVVFVYETGMSVNKTQSVSVVQSWYQRKRDLASILISNAETRFAIPMLPLQEANDLRDLLLDI